MATLALALAMAPAPEPRTPPPQDVPSSLITSAIESQPRRDSRRSRTLPKRAVSPSTWVGTTPGPRGTMQQRRGMRPWRHKRRFIQTVYSVLSPRTWWERARNLSMRGF